MRWSFHSRRNEGKHEGGVFLAPDTLKRMLAAAPRGSDVEGGLFICKKNDEGKVH